MNVACADHRAHIGQRPCGDFVTIRKFGQIRLRIRIVVQFQRSRYNGHGFFARDGRVGSHRRAGTAVIRPHLDGERHVFVIPLGFCNVLVLRNVSRFVAAERPVDNRSHLRTGHISVRVDNGAGFAVKQTVIYGGAYSFGVPRFCVIVLEICSLAGGRVCRRRGYCQ